MGAEWSGSRISGGGGGGWVNEDSRERWFSDLGQNYLSTILIPGGRKGEKKKKKT